MINYLKNILILIRVNQPIGFLLLFFPCVWGVFAATHSFAELYDNLYLIILFFIGSIIMRGAGCIINDIFDYKLDRKVERTKNRPIAANKISIHNATVLFIFFSLIGLCILLSLNSVSILIGIISFVLLVFYPLSKRFTHWPQLILGITFNTGVLIGYASITGQIDQIIFYVYIAGIMWTLGYDTIYAHQDKKDDLIVGVKSTAILFGKNTKLWLTSFYSLVIFMLFIYGMKDTQGFLFYIGLILISYLLIRQIITLNIENPSVCLAIFKSNQYVGFTISLVILLRIIN